MKTTLIAKIATEADISTLAREINPQIKTAVFVEDYNEEGPALVLLGETADDDIVLREDTAFINGMTLVSTGFAVDAEAVAAGNSANINVDTAFSTAVATERAALAALGFDQCLVSMPIAIQISNDGALGAAATSATANPLDGTGVRTVTNPPDNGGAWTTNINGHLEAIIPTTGGINLVPIPVSATGNNLTFTVKGGNILVQGSRQA